MYRHLIPKPAYQKLAAGLVGILLVAIIVSSSYLPNDRESKPGNGVPSHLQNEQWQQERDTD